MRQTYFAVILSAAVFLPVEAKSQAAVAPVKAVPQKSQLKADFELAYRLKAQERSEEALAAFNAILRKNRGNHIALIEAGYLHASLRHYELAIKYLTAASAQNPRNMRLRMDLGYAHLALKQYAAAGEQFVIVAGEPGEFQSVAQGALVATRRALAVSGHADTKHRELMERGYTALNRGEQAQARQAFETVLAKDSKDVAALKQLGFINFAEGKLAEAAANFEAVRVLQPNDYFVALQLGYTYDKLKKKELARAAFAAALASNETKIHDAAQTALETSGNPRAPMPVSPM